MFYTRSNKNNDHMEIDPDAPTRAEPTIGEVVHWLVVNIPGTDIKKGEVYVSKMDNKQNYPD